LASVLFLWMVVPHAWAQDTVVIRLQGRADSLLRAWRDAQAIANVADSLERERATAGRDTIAVGHLRIIANRSPLPLRQAAERAWPAIDSLYGSAAADLIQYPYIIRAVDPDTTVRRSVYHVGLEVPWDLDLRWTTTLLLANVPVPPLDRHRIVRGLLQSRRECPGVPSLPRAERCGMHRIAADLATRYAAETARLCRARHDRS